MGSRDFPANLKNFPMAPGRWVRAIYSDFSGSVGIRRKRAGVLGAWGEIRAPSYPWSIAYDLQEIVGFLDAPRKLPHGPRMVGLLHLLGFLGIFRNSAKTPPYLARGTGPPPDPWPMA